MIAERCTTHMVRPALLIRDFRTSHPSSDPDLFPGFEGTRMKWPPELRSKPRDEVYSRMPQLFIGSFSWRKTAGENPESLEMGTRHRWGGGFRPFPGPFSDRRQCVFAF